MAEPSWYVDTSAVLPLYRDEAHTKAAERAMGRVTPSISALTDVEFASALARWVRMGELDPGQADSIQVQFSDDLRSGEYERVEITEPCYWQARQWLIDRRVSLRTLDALHLACAAVHRLGMLTADIPLAEAARQLGVPVRVLR